MSNPCCPTCKSSTGLWDDNLWEGCNRCGYLFSVDRGYVNRGGDSQQINQFDSEQESKRKKDLWR